MQTMKRYPYWGPRQLGWRERVWATKHGSRNGRKSENLKLKERTATYTVNRVHSSGKPHDECGALLLWFGVRGKNRF